MLDVHPLVEALAKARAGAGSMNASTMTFVLFFQDAGIASWVRERTRAVAAKHPCRVMILDGTKGDEVTHLDPPTDRGEWIEIGVHDCGPGELIAALSQLALPEAPIVLAWISADIADDMRFAILAGRTDTVIVSTSLTRTDGSALTDLTTFNEHYPQIVVQDISYLRIFAWQEIVAEFFDQPAMQSELNDIQEVEITAGSEPEMLYMVGWLASRLAWTPDGMGTFTMPGGALVRTKYIHDGPPRRLSKVVLRSSTSTFTAEVHPQDDSAVCLSVDGAVQSAGRCAPLHTLDIASLVERAILHPSRDEVFIESLTMAKHILELQRA